MMSEVNRQTQLPVSSPEMVDALIRKVSDITIATNLAGEIEDVSCNVAELEELNDRSWIGLPLEQTVTEECRPKIQAMLAAAHSDEETRWREINHVFDGGANVPIRYQAFRAGETVIFLGREQRSLADLQSRLVRAQQALDQDYGRLRQMETRYRVLFQTSSEPLMIADATSLRVHEANAAALRLLGLEAQDLTGMTLGKVLHGDDRPRLQESVERLRNTGGTVSVLGSSQDRELQIELRITLFRAAEAMMVLCRMNALGQDGERETVIEQMLVGMVARMTDAVVVTDIEGRILWCNEAFLGMAEVAVGEQIQGESLARFLERPGVDMDVILGNARRQGRVRAFASVLRGSFGSTTQVEISAADLPMETPPAVGFVLRDISRHRADPSGLNGSSGKSVDNLIELVGAVPLKELVRASTDEIEKMCIETALKMTGNNRASAAEMLGLSRQSLYVKLRRFGLIDLD